MRKFFQYLLKRPLTWMANRFSGSPEKKAVFQSLSSLYKSGMKKQNHRLITLPINAGTDPFIIFSDQHKGNGDKADDFAGSSKNYIAALSHYLSKNYHYINLGDSEELWKYKVQDVLSRNKEALELEAKFQHGKKYFRTFGNHDLIWKNRIDVERLLKPYFTLPQPVPEGVLLKTKIGENDLDIFLTHGHQGDKMSDNNALSTWLVAHIWAPLQRYLQINVNTPSKDDKLRNKHNKLMHEWSNGQKNLLLITGHTHQPVFASGKYSSHPSNQIEWGQDERLRPVYYNSGCCCFSDGDITGIEISNGEIRLIKWFEEKGASARKVLESITLEKILEDMD